LSAIYDVAGHDDGGCCAVGNRAIGVDANVETGCHCDGGTLHLNDASYLVRIGEKKCHSNLEICIF
jgi:hypothetical protein